MKVKIYAVRLVGCSCDYVNHTMRLHNASQGSIFSSRACDIAKNYIGYFKKQSQGKGCLCSLRNFNAEMMTALNRKNEFCSYIRQNNENRYFRAYMHTRSNLKV